MPPVDLRAGVHDRVDAVVAVRELGDLDHRADREEVGVGGGDARAHVDPRRRRGPLAVACRREAEPHSGSGGGGQLLVGLPGREARVQKRHLVQDREEDDGDRGDEDLAPGRVAQKHKIGFPWGAGGPSNSSRRDGRGQPGARPIPPMECPANCLAICVLRAVQTLAVRGDHREGDAVGDEREQHRADQSTPA